MALDAFDIAAGQGDAFDHAEVSIAKPKGFLSKVKDVVVGTGKELAGIGEFARSSVNMLATLPADAGNFMGAVADSVVQEDISRENFMRNMERRDAPLKTLREFINPEPVTERGKAMTTALHESIAAPGTIVNEYGQQGLNAVGVPEKVSKQIAGAASIAADVLPFVLAERMIKAGKAPVKEVVWPKEDPFIKAEANLNAKITEKPAVTPETAPERPQAPVEDLRTEPIAEPPLKPVIEPQPQKMTVYHGSNSPKALTPGINGNVHYFTDAKPARLYGKVVKQEIEVSNPMEVDARGMTKGEWGNYEELVQEAKSKGNDALIIKNVIDVPSGIEEGYYKDRTSKYRSNVVIPIKQEKNTFPHQADVHANALAKTLEEAGLSLDHPAAKAVIEERRTRERTPDPTTGLIAREHHDPTVARAYDEAQIGQPFSYADIDLANLGGLNEALGGNEGANPHVKAMLQIVDGIVKENHPAAQVLRKGGDEFAVVAPGVSVENLSTTLAKAKEAVKLYATENGLDAIGRKESPDVPYGTGIHYGAVDLGAYKSREAAVKAADALTLADKNARKESVNVNRGQTETIGAVAPERQAGRVEESTGTDSTGRQETTSVKNAFTDAEREASGLPPIETPIGGKKAIQTSFDEGKSMVESGGFNAATIESLIKNPRTISDSENMALLYTKQRNRNSFDSVTEKIIEARKNGDAKTVEALKAERDAIELERQQIDKAGKAVGTEWGRAGRARQEEIAQDYSLQRNIQRARSESPSGEITPEHRAEIESLTKRLEAVMKDAETKSERIANLEAEMALKTIQREENAARRKGQRKATKEALDTEFADLTKELNSILNPNKLNAGVDPAVIPVIAKMARNRIQKGMTKAADIVDDIYNALEGKIEKREIAQAIASYKSDGKKVSKVKEDAPARKLAAKEEALKRQIDAVVAPMTFGKKAHQVFFEAWKAALLSGPKTHIVNITSNALTIGLKPVETLIASGIESARAKITGQNPEVFKGETAADIVGLRAGIDEGFRRAARGWAEALPPEEMLKHNEAQNMYAIPGRTGKIVRIPFRALSAADAFFKAVAESSELYRLAYKQAAKEGKTGEALKNRVAEIIQAPDGKIIEAAKKEADYRTFNSEFGPFGKWISSARRIPYIGVLANVLMPFLRTPINIAKYGLERTPLNFGRLLYKAFKNETRGAALSEELAKPVMGTMITAAVINGVISGNITGGGPKDKADKEALYRTGWQPYSIKIGDKYYSYNRFEPIGMIFGTTADFADLAFGNEANVKTATQAANAVALSIAKNWTSKTFMQSLSAALDATSDPGRYGQQFLNGYARSLVPSVVNTITDAMDETRRDVRSTGAAIEARIPFASENLVPKLDLWGREVKKPGLTGIDRALSPVNISTESTDLVDKGILKLGMSPGMPQRKLKGNILTEEQYNEYVKEAGKKSHKIVGNILKTNASDEAKKRMIDNAISTQREIAGNKLMIKWGLRKVKGD